MEKIESDTARISYLIGYLENENLMRSMLGITGSSHDFTTFSAEVKSSYLHRLTRHSHHGNPNTKGNNNFYYGIHLSYAMLVHVLHTTVLRFTDRINRLFVPRFYHDRRNVNFLKGLVYRRTKREIDEKKFSEIPLLGRRLFEYCINDVKAQKFHTRELDSPFAKKYYSSIGFTVHGFSFEFKNAPRSISSILNPQDGLINVENGLEEATNDLTEELFFSSKKSIEEKIAET